MISLSILDEFPIYMRQMLYSAIILIVVFVVYRILIRFISRTSERLELTPHIVNTLRLLIRVLTMIASIYVVLTMFQISTTIFVGGSALVGAMLGFGSSQTINNIIAGFYVLITQPFRIKDYVKIGDLEGQVEEITVNYTNLYTPTFNLLKVPNMYVMNSRILNMTHEGFIKYTFTVNFSHDFPNTYIEEKCISPAIEEFQMAHETEQLRRPEAYLDITDRLGMYFMIRLFIPKGDAKSLYVLKPELLRMIMNRWSELRQQ